MAKSSVRTGDTEGPLSIRRRLNAQLVLTAAFLLIVVGVLVAGGLYVRSTVRQAFHDAEDLRTARLHVAIMLKQQLDEEVGIRGYAAVPVPSLLAPYYGGRANLPLYVRRVRSDLKSLGVASGLPALRDAESTNARWLHQVAFPLIVKKGRREALELRGKALVDRFRMDATVIDTALRRRIASVNERVETAVVWVGGFAAGAAVAVVAAALIFTIAQYRLGVRFERERAASEEERRKTAEVRAAYETEKRIADTLQAAFAQPSLPTLPRVSFSASYVPASDAAKLGGDWYDVQQVANDRVLLTVGDASGHGLEAIVGMHKAQQLLTACALVDASPDRVLTRANAELVRQKSLFVTAIVGIVDAPACRFAYAVAGHPPPVLLEPGRPARLLKFGALPLGVAADAVYEVHHVQTVAGAMIVLYTDGLIEHSHNVVEGEALLLGAVESAAELPAGDVAKSIHEVIFQDHKVADDVAILALWFSEARAAGISIAGRHLAEAHHGALRWPA